MTECNECGKEFKDNTVFVCEVCNELLCDECIDEHKKEHIELEEEHNCCECSTNTGTICSNCGDSLCEGCEDTHSDNCIDTEEFKNIKEYDKEKVVERLDNAKN